MVGSYVNLHNYKTFWCRRGDHTACPDISLDVCKCRCHGSELEPKHPAIYNFVAEPESEPPLSTNPLIAVPR